MTGHLLVVGAVNIDLVVPVQSLPGPGETVVGDALQRHGGGKGGNSAVAAVRAGAKVRYVGAVGDDQLGSGALTDLRADGVDASDVAVKPKVAAGCALIVVDAKGENQIAVAAGANMRLTVKDVETALGRSEGWTSTALVSTEVTPDAVVAAVKGARARGWLCVLNPAPVIPEILETLDLAPIVTPNRGELRDIYGLLGGEGAPNAKNAAAFVVRHTGAAVVVTLGSEGVLVCDAEGQCTTIPARPAARVVDTTGAGDTFNGVFAARLAAGDGLLEAARRGVTAASLSVEAAGARTSMPMEAEIEAAFAAQ